MKIVEFCIKYPVTVFVGVILVVLFGGLAVFRLPLQMTPAVDYPQITVETRYEGAGPLEVEREVTERLEEKLNSVENLDEITSVSAEGQSTIILKFAWGVNKDIARLDASEKLDLVTDLPEDARQSVIRAVNTEEQTPIAWITIETTRDINEVWQEADAVIKPRLERIGGVGAVWMFGGQDREVHVLLDAQAMSARGITIAQVRAALLGESRNIRGGRIEEGRRQYLVRTMGEYTALRQLENVVVHYDARGPVYIRDIASVRFGYEDQDFAVRTNGTSTIGFGILKRTGANTVEVMQRLRVVLRELNTIYEDKGIRLVQAYDETVYIYDAVKLVVSNLVLGGLLATAVLLLFLRNPVSVLIISGAIPISIVSTLLFLAVLGRSLNIVTLAGLAFATGMTVDNAIVVLENIFRHRHMGKSRLKAALDGATEVWGAILAGTATTVAVFIPIIAVEGEAGQLFRDIAIAIAFGVAASLVVALTVIPMLSSRLLADGEVPARAGRLLRSLRAPLAAVDRLAAAFVGGVLGLLTWLARGWRRRVGAVGLVTAAALGLAYLLLPPLDYLPTGNRNLFLGLVKFPPGSNIEQKKAVIEDLESRLLTIPELERIFAVVRIGDSFVGAIAKREYSDLASMQRILGTIRQKGFGLPGITGAFFTQTPLFQRQSGGFIGGINLDINVKGPDLTTLQEFAERIQGRLRALPPVNFVNTSFEVGSPELQVHVDREKAAGLGISVSEVGFVAETLVNGTLAGKFRERGKELDIRLKSASGDIARTQDLSRVLFHTPAGRTVRLSDIAEVRPAVGPVNVEHIDLERAIKLVTNIREELPLETAMALVERDVVRPLRAELPIGYAIDVSGQAKDLAIAWDSIKWSFLLAVIVVYLLMCSLFESWMNPFVIMFTVPLAAAGGVLGVRLAHAIQPATRMDVLTMLGFVILTGVVVNNAILIVHQCLQFMAEGRERHAALLDSVRTRIRPIFMTTTTTVFGLLPLVVAGGAGSELYRGLGAAIVGGIVFSTVVSLVVVPAAFSLWLDVREALPAWAKRFDVADPAGRPEPPSGTGLGRPIPGSVSRQPD
ncbi:MAG: efflux RND transporter permease subunit [Zetaproteobacteria bacterium]|nr:MAG: efflux RND transporter permease subunit [Zetaproteobacteria bacterium]